MHIVKKLAPGPVLLLTALGIIILALAVLDIREGLRINLPLTLLNTIFVFVVAVLVAYFVVRGYSHGELPEMLWLGAGIIASGIGGMYRVWMLDMNGNTIITVEDTTLLLASILHLIGVITSLCRQQKDGVETGRKPAIAIGTIIVIYLVVVAVIAVVTRLALRDITPAFLIPGEGTTTLHDSTILASAFCFLVASVLALYVYIRSRLDFHYWYFLGLFLFAFGILFLSQGSVDSAIAWVGRLSVYAGGCYFLLAVLSNKLKRKAL